ncbi:MAG: transglycosylase family protein [Acidimicrobiia bacterium]
MSMDAGSTRVSIGSRTRTFVALLVATVSFVAGAAPAAAATNEQDAARRPVRTEIGQPATVVVNRVEQSMRESMTGVAFTVAVLDARRRAEETERLRAALTWVTGVQAAQAEKAARDAVWDRIAACETGGNWSMRGSRYSGGVGFANTTWNAFGGQEFASNAGLATREEQIIVAERVYDYGGYTGWGCAYTIGLLSR